MVPKEYKMDKINEIEQAESKELARITYEHILKNDSKKIPAFSIELRIWDSLVALCKDEGIEVTEPGVLIIDGTRAVRRPFTVEVTTIIERLVERTGLNKSGIKVFLDGLLPKEEIDRLVK